MTIFAIDPGPETSAFLKWDSCEKRIIQMDANTPNRVMIDILCTLAVAEVFAIEMVACMGMAVGREVFETVLWVGRFSERCQHEPILVYRRQIKMHHCGSMKAKDTNIRQALIDKYGAPGTKKAQGVTYGLKSHLWSAFAIATFISETSTEGKSA